MALYALYLCLLGRDAVAWCRSWTLCCRRAAFEKLTNGNEIIGRRMFFYDYEDCFKYLVLLGCADRVAKIKRYTLQSYSDWLARRLPAVLQNRVGHTSSAK